MKILSITAGAGGMYCGSCLRDNTLAAELMAQGHDVLLVPLYTPPLTDEPSVSQRRVFFGGISVYLEQHSALFRSTPGFLDRLWDSPRLIEFASRRSIRVDPQSLGELTVSILRGEEGFQRKELSKLLDWLKTESPPDVVNIQHGLLIALAQPIRRLWGRPICCTLQGDDLFLDGLGEPYRAQALDLIRAGAAHVDAFVAVSEYYAKFMPQYLGIPEGKMRVAPLGINLAGHDPAPRPRSDVFTLGYFARIAPEKGLHLLAEAYRRLRLEPGLGPARLEAAGYLAAEHRKYLGGVERQMNDWGLGAEFHYRGAPDRAGKIAFLRGLDVLSVPSVYADPKGTYLLEAMANGVPVVQPRRGAFPEIIRKTSGGLLVDPDAPGALAAGILSLWKDPARAREIGQQGAAGVRQHYSSSHMAAAALEVYDSLRAAVARA